MEALSAFPAGSQEPFSHLNDAVCDFFDYFSSTRTHCRRYAPGLGLHRGKTMDSFSPPLRFSFLHTTSPLHFFPVVVVHFSEKSSYRFRIIPSVKLPYLVLSGAPGRYSPSVRKNLALFSGILPWRLAHCVHPCFALFRLLRLLAPGLSLCSCPVLLHRSRIRLAGRLVDFLPQFALSVKNFRKMP